MLIPLLLGAVGVLISVGMLVVAVCNLIRIRRDEHVARRQTIQRHPSTWQNPHVRTKAAIDLPLGPRQ